MEFELYYRKQHFIYYKYCLSIRQENLKGLTVTNTEFISVWKQFAIYGILNYGRPNNNFELK